MSVPKSDVKYLVIELPPRINDDKKFHIDRINAIFAQCVKACLITAK